MHLKVLVSLFGAWMLLVFSASSLRTDIAFSFAYHVLPWSALLVPALVGTIGILWTRGSFKSLRAKEARISAALASYALCCVAYAMAFVVLARLLEIPWRRAKFGTEALDLGVSAAVEYTAAAAIVLSLAVALLRWAPQGSRASAALIAAVWMLAFALSGYLLVGLTPLVQCEAELKQGATSEA